MAKRFELRGGEANRAADAATAYATAVIDTTLVLMPLQLLLVLQLLFG